MGLTLTILLGVLLSFANGANDNFKGVSTIFGSGIASFRTSLAWATLTTFAGSVFTLILTAELLQRFTGKGLVPEVVFQNPYFGLSVATAAALTVLLASRWGLPVSTTHAITGALIGAGLVGSTEGVSWSKLGMLFFLPLLLSPVAAVVLTLLINKLGKKKQSDADAEPCVCRPNTFEALPGTAQSMTVMQIHSPEIILGKTSDMACSQANVKITSSQFARAMHFLSAGIVSFSRGVNDTPKIAALILTTGALSAPKTLFVVAIMMAVGGLLYSRRVAETISEKITPIDESGGLTANLVTALLVLTASRFGLPVSTTHVSTGAIFGIGASSGKLAWGTLRTILLAWLLTLPLAAFFAMIAYQIF